MLYTVYTVARIGDIPVVWYENGSIKIREVDLVKSLTRVHWAHIERLESGEPPSWKEQFLKKYPGVENLRTIQFAERNWPCDLKIELKDGHRIVRFPDYIGDLVVVDNFTPAHKDHDTVFFETVELHYNKKKIYAVIENGKMKRIGGGMPIDRIRLRDFIKKKGVLA